MHDKTSSTQQCNTCQLIHCSNTKHENSSNPFVILTRGQRILSPPRLSISPDLLHQTNPPPLNNAAKIIHRQAGTPCMPALY